MQDRVQVRSFEAVGHFRAALLRFIDTTNGAITNAEIEITRTINWLETEQIPYWRTMLRNTADEVEKAKTAYRDKALYKDATGARHTAIDELRALRRAEAKRAEVEKRAAATKRNLRQLQRELTLYKGNVQQLASMVNGRLQLGAEELRRAVEQLERYVHAAPESPAPAEQHSAGGMGCGEAGAEAVEEAIGITPLPDGAAERESAAADELLRRRTPRSQARGGAKRGESAPVLPDVPREMLDALGDRMPEESPGKYELLTSLVGSGVWSGAIYLERGAPAFSGDTGWHIGPAGAEGPGARECVTITVGRVASGRPEVARLLSLPVGWLLRAEGGRFVRAVDALGRTMWESAGH